MRVIGLAWIGFYVSGTRPVKHPVTGVGVAGIDCFRRPPSKLGESAGNDI